MKSRHLNILAFICLTSMAASPGYSYADGVASIVQRVDDYVGETMDQLDIPGASLALIYDGDIVHTNAWGITGGTKKPVSVDTPFTIGSNSKALTAYAVMILVQRGKVRLDDPVQRHLPDFDLKDSSVASLITVRDLLSHTSGISAYDGYRLSDRHTLQADALQRTVEKLQEVSPATEPGSQYDYSPANYVVLGALIESVSGKTFAEFIQQEVFNPLKMRGAAAQYHDALSAGWEPGYRAWFDIPVAADPLFDTSGATYGYMTASARDMAKFVAALQRPGRILARETTRVLEEPLVETGEDMFYGYGWRIYASDTYKKIFHGGSTADFRSEIFWIPGTGWGAVLLTNRNNSMEAGRLTSVALGIEKIVNGDQPRAVAKTASPARVGLAVVILAWMLILLCLATRWRRRRRARLLLYISVAVGFGIIGGVTLPVLVYLVGLPLRSLFLFVPDVMLMATTFAVISILNAVLCAKIGTRKETNNLV